MRQWIRKRLFIQSTFPSRHECFGYKYPRNSSENHLWSRGSWAIGLSHFSLLFLHFVLCSGFPRSRQGSCCSCCFHARKVRGPEWSPWAVVFSRIQWPLGWVWCEGQITWEKRPFFYPKTIKLSVADIDYEQWNLLSLLLKGNLRAQICVTYVATCLQLGEKWSPQRLMETEILSWTLG